MDEGVGMSVSTTTNSPRIGALRRALADRETGAVEAFWQAITALGTPLVEPGATAGESTVSFLWRGPATSDVQIVCPLTGSGRAASEPLEHIPGTDVWYCSYPSRSDLRTEYSLVVDGVTHADPLNPRLLVFPPDEDSTASGGQCRSWFELPDALHSPPITLPPGTTTRPTERWRLRSQLLGNERPISVYTPPAYTLSAGTPYPLLILFDRWAYAHVIPTVTILDDLIAAGSIPPLVAVIVGHPDDTTRNFELACHAPFADFLARELLSWVRERYRVTDDPAQTIVAGMSYGGMTAVYAGLRHPERFGLVLSQSGSFYWKPEEDGEHEWLARQFAANPLLWLRFYLAAGLYETPNSTGVRPSLLLSNRHLRDVLRAKGYPLTYLEFNGHHDYVWQPFTLADGLKTLIGQSSVE
jgi:enterochelin esterase-like enzyme